MTVASDSRRYRGPILFALAFLLSASCTGGPGPSTGRQQEPSTRPAAQRKAITVALRTDINALVGDAERFGGQIVASVYVQEFINAYLGVRDQADEPQAQLARELPSFEKGTWRLSDDGRMEVTWKLRQDARWHDGTPAAAGDVRFGWEVASDPASAIGLQARGTIRLIERVETPDPATVVMHWRGPSIRGGELGGQELAVLPHHLLGAAFAEGKEAFHRHPYFSSPESFVGSGPYRPIERELDRHLTVEAFDGYFLGRPKIDRVTFRIIPDSRTALANVLAGAIDISYLAVEFTEAITVRDEWARSGEGTVWLQPNQLRIIEPQMRPEYAKPADLMNPDVRRALAYATDRPSIAEAANPGAPLVVDADGVPGTRFGDAIRARAFHYDYNRGRAQALLEAAGWRRGATASSKKPASGSSWSCSRTGAPSKRGSSR